MARFASLALLGAAVVSAHPSHMHNHAHKARSVEEARAIGDTITAVIDGVEVSWVQESDYYTGETASSASSAAPAVTPAAAVANLNVNVAAAATSTTSSSAAAAATGDSTSSSSSTTDTTGYTVSEYTDFADVVCDTSSKRATLAEIAQVGNVGGTCYGSNMLVITDADVAAQYENTISFSGATEDMECTYWNKVSKSGAIAGWYKDEDSYYTFTLGAGETVYLAADNGTAGSASCFKKSTGIEFDNYGAIAGTWLEFTFVDVTTGYSGWDASCIIAEDADMTINGLEVCAEDGTQCSSIGAGLSSITKAFNSALAAADGLGGQIDGPVKLASNFGF